MAESTAPPAPPASTNASASAAAASSSAASASAASAAPSTWPEYAAAFDKLMKDPKQLALLLKTKPDLLPDQLPANSEERSICNQLIAAVEKTGNEEFRREMNEDIALRFTRGFTYNTFKKEKLSDEEAVKKTVDILLQCLEWRTAVKASTLCDRKIPKRDLFKKLWVNGVSGVDKDGRQVWVVHPPSKQVMVEFTPEELMLNHCTDMEAIARRKMVEGVKLGHPAYMHVVIMDLGQESISLAILNYLKKAISYTPEGAKEALSIDEWFYPDIMKNMWLINAPFIFKAIWAVAKPFIHPVTAAKFKICGSDFLGKMAEAGIGKDSLPRYLGGTGADPVGFHYKIKVSAGTEEVVKLPVRAGDKVLWDIEIESKDANITGQFVGETKETLVETTLLKAGECIRAERQIESNGELRFVFNNKHSSWYSKTIRYDIRVLEATAAAISAPAAASGASSGAAAAAAASTE